MMQASAFLSSIRSFESRLGGELHVALTRASDAASGFAKTSSLYKSHTFELRNSIETRVFGGFGGVLGAGDPSAQVRATAQYAGFVENGTRPHVIVPRKALRMLRFEVNGAIRFARIVRHPGTKPRPFMQEARDRAEPIAERLAVEAVTRAMG